MSKTVEFVKPKIIKGDMLDVFEVLEECIRLLSIDGANTKQQVKEMLERLVDGNE